MSDLWATCSFSRPAITPKRWRSLVRIPACTLEPASRCAPGRAPQALPRYADEPVINRLHVLTECASAGVSFSAPTNGKGRGEPHDTQDRLLGHDRAPIDDVTVRRLRVSVRQSAGG